MQNGQVSIENHSLYQESGKTQLVKTHTQIHTQTHIQSTKMTQGNQTGNQ